jgi:hypothetical protein
VTWAQPNVTSYLPATYASSSNVTIYPTAISFSDPNPLRQVLDSPTAELTGREWLDAQIEEVCALAAS